MGFCGYTGSIIYTLATAGMLYSCYMDSWSVLTKQSIEQYPDANFHMGLFRTTMMIDLNTQKEEDTTTIDKKNKNNGIVLDETSYSDFCNPNTDMNDIFDESNKETYCYLISTCQIGMAVAAMIGFTGTVVSFILSSGVIKPFVFSSIGHLAATFQFFQGIIGLGCVACWYALQTFLNADFDDQITDFKIEFWLASYVAGGSSLLAILACTFTTILSCHYKDRSEDYRRQSDLYKNTNNDMMIVDENEKIIDNNNKRSSRRMSKKFDDLENPSINKVDDSTSVVNDDEECKIHDDSSLTNSTAKVDGERIAATVLG